MDEVHQNNICVKFVSIWHCLAQ